MDEEKTYTLEEVDEKLDLLVKEVLKQINDAWEETLEWPADQITTATNSFKENVLDRIENIRI